MPITYLWVGETQITGQDFSFMFRERIFLLLLGMNKETYCPYDCWSPCLDHDRSQSKDQADIGRPGSRESRGTDNWTFESLVPGDYPNYCVIMNFLSLRVSLSHSLQYLYLKHPCINQRYTLWLIKYKLM